MQRSRPSDLPASVDTLRARMQRWRQSPSKGCRMPEALWQAAARLARAHGLSPVAKALGLDYYSLKKRTGSVSGTPAPAAPVSPVFVELGLPSGAGGIMLELAARDGAKMTARIPDGSHLDLVALAEAFWRRRR